ncbi:RHS repeat-associated core domain-containing protein, partial [Streptomyces sp. NPDC002073]
WNATDTVNPDGTVQIKADFTGPNSATGATQPLSVIVDRNASGAASEQVGPGTVNLLTGDFALSASDASAFGLSASRSTSSRQPGAGVSEGQAAIYGKEWVSGTTAELTDANYSHVRKVSGTAVDVVLTDGTAVHFSANAAQNGWIPEAGSEEFVLTGSVTGSFTLADSSGNVTEFTKPDAGATTWQASSSFAAGIGNSTTSVVSETVTVDGKKLARPKRVIAPTSAASAATCAADPSVKGCRVMEFVYATSTTATGHSVSADFGDFAGQVKEIRLWATDPGAAAATATAVSTFRYDLSGRLRQSWDPRLGQIAQTQYSYDSAGRVNWYDVPGQLPWTFTYGKAGNSSAAGDGMLLKASRAGLKQGTTDVQEGTATTTVVYDVPLTGAKAPYAMGAADVKAWGQTDAPTDATAVFQADSVPASNSGDALTAGDYARATVSYLGASARAVNSAAPGGHITTGENDHFGNAVRELTAGNRAVALGLTAADRAVQADLGIAQLSSADRAELLSSRTVYSEDGSRELEQFGPLRRVELTSDLKSGATVLVGSGTSVTARAWTVNEYDAGRPTDGSAKIKGQVTKVTAGAQVREHPTVLGETTETQTVFDWTKGIPLKSVVDPSGLAVTTSTETDAEGRIVKQLLPGANGADAATRVTTYWSATGTGTCQGRPEWAGMVCSTGPGGAITGGGSQPSQMPVKTTEYDRWGNAAKVTETANGSTRTTTIGHDAAGRVNSVKTTGGLGQAMPDTATEYDPASGAVVRTTSPTAGTVTREYDKLGRPVAYTDADGGRTTTEYDLLGRPVKSSDSVPSTVTYTYDHAVEPRGFAVRTTDSVAGAFEAGYDADGQLVSEKLPGGYTLRQSSNTVGAVTSRVYTRDSDAALVYSDTVTQSVHGQVASHTGWSAQSYRYDKSGRLSSVEDTADTVCTRRGYAFDARSNRTSLTTATGTPGADCPATGGTVTTSSYDSADRLVDAGYVYDAFGRTTSLPGHGSIGYYVNDLVHQQTAGGERQTWSLDPTLRFRSWKKETGSGSTWTTTASKVNHFDADGDSPRWIVEDATAGTLTRNIASAGSALSATTSKTGDTTLQMTTIHGDVALQLPLDVSKAPVAIDADEFGNPRAGQAATRYGWLGAKQRSAETLSGLTLMGVRLYNAQTGRFLSPDPVYGGNANAYVYPGDPVNSFDLDGRASARGCNWWCEQTFWALEFALGNIVCRMSGWWAVLCEGLVGGTMALAQYAYRCAGRCWSWGTAGSKFAWGFVSGSGIAGGWYYIRRRWGGTIRGWVYMLRRPILRYLGRQAWDYVRWGLDAAGL